MEISGEGDLIPFIHHAPVGICVLHAHNLTVEATSMHFVNLIDKRGEDITGKFYPDLVSGTIDGDESALKKMGGGQSHYFHRNVTLPNTGDSDETISAALVYTPVRNGQGKVTRIAIWVIENTSHALNEQLSAINEELAAVNEEYTAVNEELAATNEELTTVNEELAATNGELLETQESLRRSEKLFRSIALNIPGSVIIVIDRQHRYVIIEGDIMDKLGYNRRDYEGKHPSEISPERYAASKPLYDRVLAGEKFTIERKSETGEVYLVHFVPLKNETEEIEAGLIIALDISEIKLAEERSLKLASIVETSDDAIISKTLESIITSWNAAAERMFGYTADEMIGQSIYTIIPEDRKDEEARILARLRTGERVDHFETKRRHKDGHLLDVSLTISPLKNKQGEIIGLSKIARDITAQKQEEQRKNDFIGMASHELRTPLTSLTAIIQVARQKFEKYNDPFLSNAMEKANFQVRRMSAMINGFLNISRLEAGKLQIVKKPFDLKELMEEILEETRLTTSSHSFSVNECDDIIVEADRDKISSVISNLISNAVKYSAKGRTVDIRCQRDGASVVVSVKDEGIGIKPADLARIFDRYYRVETNDTRNIAGFGIGLYLSAEIIALHHGKIWVESELGKGTTFYFSLPLEA